MDIFSGFIFCPISYYSNGAADWAMPQELAPGLRTDGMAGTSYIDT